MVHTIARDRDAAAYAEHLRRARHRRLRLGLWASFSTGTPVPGCSIGFVPRCSFTTPTVSGATRWMPSISRCGKPPPRALRPISFVVMFAAALVLLLLPIVRRGLASLVLVGGGSPWSRSTTRCLSSASRFKDGCAAGKDLLCADHRHGECARSSVAAPGLGSGGYPHAVAGLAALLVFSHVQYDRVRPARPRGRRSLRASGSLPVVLGEKATRWLLLGLACVIELLALAAWALPGTAHPRAWAIMCLLGPALPHGHSFWPFGGRVPSAFTSGYVEWHALPASGHCRLRRQRLKQSAGEHRPEHESAAQETPRAGPFATRRRDPNRIEDRLDHGQKHCL